MKFFKPFVIQVIVFLLIICFDSSFLFAYNKLPLSVNIDNGLIDVDRHLGITNSNNKEEIFDKIETLDINSIYASSNQELQVDTNQFDLAFKEITKVDEITDDVLVKLPIGIEKDFGNGCNAQLLVVNAYFTTEYIALDLLAMVEWSTNYNGAPVKRKLRFGCWNAKYYYKYGFKGENNLVLLNDIDIPISKEGSTITIEGDFNKSTGIADLNKASYIKFGCNGIESLEGSFKGEVLLQSTDECQIIPVTKTGSTFEQRPNDKMSAKFNTTCSLDNFYFSVSLGYLTIGGSDFIFNVTSLTVDKSASQSHAYFTEQLGGKLWEGFYVGSCMVYLPEGLSKNNIDDQNKRASIYGKNLIIDEQGLSCKFGAKDIMNLKTGTIGNWPMSIQELEFDIKENKFQSVNFKGSIAPSVLDTASALNYSCYIDPILEKYVFGLDTKASKPLALDLFLAQIKIEGGSLTYDKGKDEVSVTLSSGDITLKGDKLSSIGLRFEGFTVSNKPSISIKSIGPLPSSNPGALADFPITLKKVSVFDNKLNIAAGINLMDGKFGGSVSTDIKFKPSITTKGRQKWEYEGINIGQIGVKANFDKFSLNGNVEFFDNSTDKGFKGDVKLKLGLTSDSILIASKAIFGTRELTDNQSTNGITNRFRYWHVDLEASFSKPVPLFAGIGMVGIGGGAANHMVHNTNGNFVPDPTMGLFLRANTQLLMPGTAASNPSQIALELQFNKDFGLTYMQLFGELSMAPNVNAIPGASTLMDGYKKLASASKDVQDKIKSLKDGDVLNLLTSDFTSRFPSISTGTKAEVKLDFLLNMDFTNNTFAGKAGTYVNVMNVITGTGSKGSAGNVYMAFRKNEWFVHAGYQYYGLNSRNIPDVGGATVKKFEPLGLQLKIGDLKVVSVKGYFLMGHHIPELPDPTKELGISNFPSEGMNLMSKVKRGADSNFEGQGLAFGAAAEFQLDDIKSSIIVAKAYAYMGFDVLLKQYAESKCSLWPDNNNFGINNWWAQGKAYAGLGTTIGVNVDVWGYQEMAKANMAVLLQAQFPNPTYFSGTMSGRYKVLEIFEGNFNLNVAFGQKCGNLIESVSEVEVPEIEIVESTNPDNGSQEAMSSSGTAYVKYNYPMNESLEGAKNGSLEGTHKMVCVKVMGKSIRVPVAPNKVSEPVLKSATTLKSTTLSAEEPVKELNLVPKWVSNKKMNIEFADSSQSWDANSEVELEVDIALQVMQNGEWVVKKNMVDGVELDAIETIKMKFKTGGLSENLELGNIVAMYPALGQEYFYTGESEEGLIKINPKQDYLFNGVSFVGLDFESAGEPLLSTIATYQSENSIISYSLPDLLPNKDYLVRIKKGTSAENAQTVFSFTFHTSKFATIDEKLASINSLLSRPESNTAFVPFSYEYDEPFGKEEIFGNEFMNKNQPLLTATIDIENTENYWGKFFNFIYTKLPQTESCGLQPIMSINPSAEIVGLKPYSSNWDVLKNEMVKESTFPYVLASLNKIHDDFRVITDHIQSICSNKFEYCTDLRTVVQEFLSGECEYALPNQEQAISIPLKLVYKNSDKAVPSQVKSLSMSYIY